ncbi:VRR-NUC domain [Pseudomonas putida]|uniref:VRR-NUC domain-containing protein n=1 Tax=Pseudomonas guariconensis TaxID=1288410 RepID=UPI001F8F719A|nr:VRR-NUC domain-containing protein [Pseudomonas guariconensis]CAB5585206.1 VRR-NUC domain [Pseudomonas putida]MDM9594672.1 VRR-NUC domain-containing protein [Pseudomonas guariconensis]MDM9607502.1 VRR-NUC domain-containing protein [Pseudomonas guariconensis]CAB5585974.1 VRR-NUC domain [Pseudomonas putida]CAB5627274.1 VRR-NUC domain [Pseudomonas putida]
MKSPVVRRYKPNKPSAKRVDREGPEQAALMKEIQLRYPEAYELLYHVPNGGHRLKEVAAKLKAQGVKAGIPDLVLTMARGGYFGLYIEFKATVDPAPVSSSQQACIRRLNEQGYLAVVCRGHFDAMECLRAYLALPKTEVAA